MALVATPLFLLTLYFFHHRSPDSAGPPTRKFEPRALPASIDPFVPQPNPTQVSKNQIGKSPVPEWCEPEDSEKLARHPIFERFSGWLDLHDKTSCSDKLPCLGHDPRLHRNLVDKGLELSRVRARVMTALIGVDPSSALALAVPPERIQKLPEEIKNNMERWHSASANIKAVHVCFHPSSPKGQVNRWVTLPDGKTYRAYVYGARRYMPTLQKVPIAGISLNGEMAVSEKPYRIVSEIAGDRLLVEYAGKELKLDQPNGIQALERRVGQAELQALPSGRFRGPIVASSAGGGGTNLVEHKYELVTTPMTWADANNSAYTRNGRLVSINSAAENNIVYQLLKDAMAFGLLPDGSGIVQHAWIGATDFEDQNGTYYDRDTNSTKPLEVNASEGNWHWLSNEDVSASTYQNWQGGLEPANANEDYAAMDWSNASAQWIDHNGSQLLPFVVEYELDLTPKPSAFVNGKRKVLVYPTAFRDEGNDFDGSSSNPVDPFGNPLGPGDIPNPFEPDTRSNLVEVMERVKQFYLRNSDGTFLLEAVITPPITVDLPKWKRVAAGTGVDNRIFDSTGLVYWSEEVDYGDGKEIGMVGEAAKAKAAQLSRDFDYDGPAFEGVLSISVPTPFGNFAQPPLVKLLGGDLNATTGIPDPDFVAAQAKALVNASGQVTEIVLLDPGSFYHGTPALYLDNVDFNSSATITMGRTIVSWAAVSTTGSGGLGTVGGPGTHVNAPASAGVMAHELGHNFGLFHSNRYVSEGLRPNSDEGETIDYGNPFSLMGSGGLQGDLTIPSKVFLRDLGHFGLKGGTEENNATDVAHLHAVDAVENSGLKETNATNPNTFRIYRHNYGSAPYALRTGSFTVHIPSDNLPAGLAAKLPLALSISGPGEGAAGMLDSNGSGIQLVLSAGGKGYSEEPVVSVFDSDGATVLLTLDPTWIVERAGTSTSSYLQSSLRNFSSSASRGLRGIEIPASEYAPLGPDAQSPFGSYWVSYRLDDNISEYGLTVTNGTMQGFGTSENALIDTTPATQGNFKDAFLLLGRTFSDYESDAHVTPVRRGGMAPMFYIEAVVNVGTVGKGLAQAPEFRILVSDPTPAVDQTIDFTVIPTDVNVSDYAYAWYQNEIGLDDARFLNQRTISRKFSSPGQYVVKVVVSDMKGGISSENVVVRVGDASQVTTTLVSGQVRSNKGPVQGAKVIISKAPFIEHTVSVSGSLQESRVPSHYSTPLRYVIDGVANKQLVLHRGEIHRFYFDTSTEGYPLSFFEHPDHEPARVKLNLLLTPLVDFAGSGYKEPPAVTLVGGSLFDTHFSQSVTTLYDYQKQPYGASGTLITMPSAKSLLMDTNVSKINVRPISSDPNTGLYLHYGGTGQNRYNTPTASVLRSSYWENYSDANATAVAYVDGVGTINVTDGGSGYPATPEIVVFGAGIEANVTGTTREKKNTDSNRKKSLLLDNSISISDQGYRFDPNSTQAVALYPLDPFIYYSFNQDESLFADNARYKPTSGFNNQIETNFKHYWQLDELNASTFDNNLSATFDLSITPAVADPSLRSKWGLKNKAIELQPGDAITGTGIFSSAAHTLSLWINPSAAGGAPSLSLASAPFSLVVNFPGQITLNGVNLVASPATGEWAHLAVMDDGAEVKAYLNGNEVGTRITSLGSDLQIGGQDCLVDEVMVYDRALNPYEIKYLAGRHFLDLSGNKYHAVPMGPGTDMASTTDDVSISNAGASQFKKDDLGRAIDLNGSRYLDLLPNLKALSALDSGTIAFWLKTDNSDEMTILSASNVDENNSYYRLFLRDNGTLRQEVLNNGSELCKVSSDATVDLSDRDWHHVVVVIDNGGVQYHVDGKSINSVIPAGASNDRAFFTDIDQLNHFAIGYHQTSEANATNYFKGQLDEFHIYKRTLTAAEIKHLYDIGNDTRVARAMLSPSVDAIGTVTVTSAGAGYKEQPEVTFTYASPDHYTNQAAGRAELNPVGVDKILLTKDFYSPVSIVLPDDRNVSRRYVEYVRVTAPPNTLYDAQVAGGVFGYSAPPDIVVAGSPTWPDDYNATGYPLFFLDPNASVEIANGGRGYDLSNGNRGFDVGAVRIFGEGYRPPAFEATVRSGSLQALVLKQPGEGSYAENPSALYFIGEGKGETPPTFSDNPFVKGSLVRRNTFSSVNSENLYDVNGITMTTAGAGWVKSPTVFADWGNTGSWGADMSNGHVAVSDLDFNSTLSDVVVTDPGFRYSIPAKVNILGGRFFDSDPSSVWRPAVVEINGTDADGGITSYRVTDGGAGYFLQPIVSITGGGGVGASAIAFMNIFTGTIDAVFPVEPGRGYHNLDANNTPVAKLSYNRALAPDEVNATISLRLGGALNKPVITQSDADPQYIAPWVEIYDRGRVNVPEGDQAEAVAKIKDGNITKIIVTKSGSGYIDPVVFVRGSAPKLDPYFTNTKRLWQCTHMREDVNGTLAACGHVHEGDAPPQACPGETPPGPKQVNAGQNANWWDGHSAACKNHHGLSAQVHHRDLGFRVRSCGGIAAEFVLINDAYRFPRTDWLAYDTTCSALVQDGKIREIVIDQHGSRYVAPHLEFKGTGGEVDPVPVFDEKGYLIDVFFDDPRIKNLEIDKLDRPHGAGQGFTERPWTKDANFDATYGPRELISFVVHAEIAYVDADGEPGGDKLLLPQSSETYGTVLPFDSWGDRVIDVEVIDGGLFSQGTQATVAIDFDMSQSGFTDGMPAAAMARLTNTLSAMQLDHNGTHTWSNFTAEDGNKRTVSRSTFLAEPEATIFNEVYDENGTRVQYSFFLDENKTSQVRLNGVVDYDPISQRSYFDLVVDDRLPNKLYYGLGDSNRTAMGGEILVGEGMPYANWGGDEQWGNVAYTDGNGFYAFSNLESGFYNVAVLMEDERYQEMTFRPDANISLVSRTVYVPGFSSLELETDRRGPGRSRLIWSAASRLSGRSASRDNPPDLSKVLEGIGGGFTSGQAVHFSFQPHPSNTGRGAPKVDYNVSVDGSLDLTIVDDANSSVFNPDDRFTLSFAFPINVSGIDFTDDFRFEDVNQSFWGGSMRDSGQRQLIIAPSAGGEHNFLEAPIASQGDPNATTVFTVRAYDQNGTAVTPITANWSLAFDFSASDGNDSKIATLDVTSGNQVSLTLRSTLRDGNMTLRSSALINGVETNASVKIMAFARVPLTSKESWMDKHFDTVLESAVDWTSDDTAKGFDGDGLTNEQEWRYGTSPFLSDTDGDLLADKVEVDATLTNPNARDTDGDGFIDSLEVDVAGLNPLAYDLSPPAPVFTLLGQDTISVYAGSKVLLGAIVKESALDGSGTLTEIAVSMEGNYSQVASYSNGEWVVSSSAPSGIYHVVYSVNDSLNRDFSKTQYLIVAALDLIPPTITLSASSPLYVLKGTTLSLPTYGAYDETDGTLTGSVAVSGDASVDVNKTGTYDITYSVTDAAGNPASLVLQVVVEDYAYAIKGKAIDGYLVGSTVIFDAYKNGVLDGVHDLSSPVVTDGSGQFVLSMTTPELQTFDLNGNGKIDSNEGRIVVSGGFDVSTNSPFTGTYTSDANSTVISPLSTLVTALMDKVVGTSKEDAKTKVIQALGLPATIDPTSYDPISAASAGDADSAKVLLETARLANLMKQADAFAEYRGIAFTAAGQAGSFLIDELAEDIGAWTQGQANPLSSDVLVQQALVSSLQTIQPGISATGVTEAIQLMRTSDNLLVQTATSGLAAGTVAVNLAKNQHAITSEVINGYGGLTSFGNSITSLNVSQQSLENLTSSISSINVFPPAAPSFTAAIRSGDWNAGKQLSIITGTDADGDSISYSITSRNFDLDGDGTLPFSVSSSGALSITDPDDLTPYAATTLEVTVTLSDGKGMSSAVQGSLQVDNLLSLTSSPITGKSGWADSSWMGGFYSAGSSWVYRPTLGWLFVSPDNSNGYWFWDSGLNAWWWTKSDVFPHFYRSDKGWSYWNLDGNSRLYYDYTSKSWTGP
tara:strand:- start:26797 stop:38664 length:11868 start_codon:yes stop_codon:yes gene_type:complete